jgi:hypothetical protein
MTAVKSRPDYETFNAYRRNRYRQQAYGRWNPWTDATIVRTHLASLAREGIGAERAAELAGVSPATVRNIIWGVKGRPLTTKVRTVIAEKILAVQPGVDALAGGARMDATGTRRRIQALAVRGFPLGWLADQLGMIPGNVSRILRQNTVEATTHRAIAALYRELENIDPAAFDINGRASTYIRNRAARKGWAPPACWDDEHDINDPQSFPDWTGHCGTERGLRLHYKHGPMPPCEPCKASGRVKTEAGRP